MVSYQHQVLSVNSIEVEYLPSKQMARVRFPVNASRFFFSFTEKLQYHKKNEKKNKKKKVFVCII